MTVVVRPTTPDEYRAAAGAMAIALLTAPPDDEGWERSRPSWEEMPSFSAWDGDRCVGHAGQFLVDTTVPGGARVPTAAVSRVGVLPTHRRRGIATRLMEALVADADERALALMSLRASEAVIYQRYGFGLAGDHAQVRLVPSRATPIAGAARVGGSFRLLDPGEILDVLPPLYDRVAHRRPGVIVRPMSFWRRYLRDATEQKKASFVAVHADHDGELDGFVHYDVEWDDEHADGPTGKGTVNDLLGGSDAVELALWQYLCDVDIVTVWRSHERPIDDVVRQACRDPRAYRTTGVEDEQWLRLVDVGRALSARTYRPVAGAVTIAVTDPLIARNNGRWRVTADGAEPTDAPADLMTDIASLSATYLGGRTWTSLAATGAVEIRSPGAVAVADDLFTHTPLPFCGSFF